MKATCSLRRSVLPCAAGVTFMALGIAFTSPRAEIHRPPLVDCDATEHALRSIRWSEEPAAPGETIYLCPVMTSLDRSALEAGATVSPATH
jgi:hypothetical protein